MDESTTTSTTVDATTTSTTVEPTTTSTTETTTVAPETTTTTTETTTEAPQVTSTTTQMNGNSIVVPQPKLSDLQTVQMELQDADARIERHEEGLAQARLDAMRNHRDAQVAAGATGASESSTEEVVA